jgi:predicted acyltransferase
MTTPPPRLVSLDQFRGLTVLAMFFVNFAGQYPATPSLFRHHDLHCTFADVIMPMFLFAVGFAMRMTFPRRVAKLGRAMAYRKAIGRSFGLILLGIVIYHLTGEWKSWEELKSQAGLSMLLKSFKSGPFQTLVHIGVASLFVLPVIESRPWVRLAFLILSGMTFLLIDLNGYHEWNRSAPGGIEGGPLGFLSWTIPLLFGTLCSDLVAGRASNVRVFLLGLLVCAVAIAIMAIGNPAATWPFQRLNLETEATANAYTMRANSATVTLTTFGAGIAFIVYAVCRFLADDRGLTLSLFELFGRNALAAYIIHDLVRQATVPFVPKDSPLWYVLAGTVVYFFITWFFVRFLDRQRLHLTL